MITTANSYNAEDHTYRGRSGLRLPGATDVIKAGGLIDTAWMTEESRWRGKAVHRGIELLVKDDLDWASVDTEVQGYLKSFQAFLTTTGFVVLGAEEPCFSDGFATLPDLWGTLNGANVILELKSGPVPKWAALQTALQAKALREDRGFKVYKRFGLQLRSDGELSKLIPFEDANDESVAMSLVQLFHWKLNNGYFRWDK